MNVDNKPQIFALFIFCQNPDNFILLYSCRYLDIIALTHHYFKLSMISLPVGRCSCDRAGQLSGISAPVIQPPNGKSQGIAAH